MNLRYVSNTKRTGQKLNVEKVRKLIAELLVLFEKTGLSSHDLSDLYETTWGRVAKLAWVKNRWIGGALSIPLELVDVFWPAVRRISAKQREHPICYAQVGLGAMHLARYDCQRAGNYLALADQCLERLMVLSVKTSNGFGWGINVRWQTKGGLIPPLTPCHTQTGYGFRFLDALQDWKAASTTEELLRLVARHTALDYQEFLDQHTATTVSGYSISDQRLVVNAMSYRMYTMLRSYELFGEVLYREKALSSLDFLVRTQNSDGSWFYGPSERFIDGYHSCFVLKNFHDSLKIIRRVVDRDKLDIQLQQGLLALKNGVSYYRDNLIDEHGFPRPFSVSKKPVLYKYDIYDIAEALGLMARIGDFESIEHILELAIDKMWVPGHGFMSRYYIGAPGVGHSISYHRYANTAFFLALVTILNKLEITDEKN